MQLVDTDVLIDVQRGHPPAVEWFAQLTEFPAVCGIVVMELVQDARNAREIKKAIKLVSPFRVVWPTEADNVRALSIFSTLHISHGIGLLDSLIGSCAVGLSATLLTFNAKHYRAMPGLSLVRPYSR
jgi:predicted nucleic acid-binding protein